MSTVEFVASWSGPRLRQGFEWGRVAHALSLLGPFLIDLIGLWPTRAVGVALIALTLWRH